MEKEGLDESEKLIQQQKIDEAVNYYLETGKFLPSLMLADGGRVAYQSGGDVMVAADTPKIDFDIIEQSAERGSPKYMEYFGAMALVTTLVWLYIEILRLLAKFRSR